MHVTERTLDLVYLAGERPGDGTVEERVGFEDGTTVSRAGTVDELGAVAATADCALVGAGREEPVEDVRRIREAHPSLPLVVFAGDEPPSIEHLTGTDGVEIVQSTVGATPPELIRDRVEAARSKAGVPGPHDPGPEAAVRGSVATGSERSLRERLEERDELLRHISENIDDVVWVTTPDKEEIEFASDAYEEVWDRPREEVYERSDAFVDGIHPDDRERVREAVERQKRDPDTYEETYRIVQGDGEIRWIHDRAFGVHEGGSRQRIVGIARDITERVERERELERQNDLFAKAQDLAAIGAWEYDAEDGKLWWTSEVYDIHGLEESFDPSLEEGLQFYHPEDRPRIRAAFEAALDEGEPYDLELRIVDADGEVRWVQSYGEPQYEDGEVVRVRGTFQDITERKRTRDRLEEEREMFAQGPVVVFRWQNEEGWPVEYVSGNVADVLGYSPEAFESGAIPYREVVVPEDRDRVAREVKNHSDATTERFSHEPYRVRTADGEVRWVEDTTKVVRNGAGEITHYLGYLVDITERKERERELTEQRDELAELDRLNRTIRDVDEALVGARTREGIERTVCEQLSESGHYRFALWLRAVEESRLEATAWTGVAEEYVEPVFPLEGLSPAESPGIAALDTGETQVVQNVETDPRGDGWRDAALGLGVESVATVPVVYDDQTYGVIGVYAGEPAAFSEREVGVLDELGRTVGHAVAAVESRDRERTLTALYGATQDLLAAETRGEIAEVVVDTAADVLEPPGIGIFLFDDDENVLWPGAATEELVAFYGDEMAFGPDHGDAVVWQTYVTGEPQWFTDIREADRVANPQTTAGKSLMLPLGEHGVFVVTSSETGRFDDRKRRLVGLLAATTEAALDRVAGRAGIRERDRELTAHAERLDRCEGLLDLIAEFGELLSRADGRTEIERGACELLAAVDAHAFAWAGTVPAEGEAVHPTAWAGSADGYLDSAALDLDGDEPAAVTARTGEPTVVPDATDRLREEAWAKDAVDRDVQSVIAVPLADGDTTYGVLTVYATSPNAFEGTPTPLMAGLGELVAQRLGSIETRQGILAGRMTEVKLAIDGPGTVLNAVADVADQPVSVRETHPEDTTGTEVRFSLADPPVEEVLALESEFVSVESLARVDGAGEPRFRLRMSDRTVAAALLDCGAIPREVVVERGETTAVVDLPRTLDVREFRERVRSLYPDTSLQSQRQVDRGTGTGHGDLTAALEDLTDRQREVLFAAYENGFFESPRETTGSELADLLGVSQPTVTYHIREAQRRLLAALLDEPV